MKKESKRSCRKKLFCGVLIGLVVAAGGHGCVPWHDNPHGVKASATAPNEYEQAENDFCYVCHLNFQDEPFATWHQNANVGCMDCHGDSDGHSADEAHVIPPDKMYKKSDINDSCIKCHSRDKLKKRIGHRRFLTESDPKHKYCTDCHGKHSIPKRHRVWDKDTGKLISADGNKVE